MSESIGRSSNQKAGESLAVDSDEARANPPSLWSRLEGTNNRLTIVVGIATFLAGALATLGLVNQYLKRHIDNTVSKRLAPYEALLTGISLNHTEDWDEAALVLQHAAADFNSAKVSPEAVNTYNDVLLYALVNSESPEKFSPEFYKIKQRIGPKVAEDAWRVHHIGWYHLRTGNLTMAAESFRRAVQMWDGHQEYRQAADGVYGLLIVALARGDVEIAIKHSDELVRRNPLLFSRESLGQYARSWDNDKANSQMKSMYAPTLEKSLALFARRLLQNSAVTQPGVSPNPRHQADG